VIQLRHAEPDDHARVIAEIDDWWGGREMAAMLPRLFFVHFRDTSFVAEEGREQLAGFLCGFLSQTYADEAYVHFVGVNPTFRGRGIGRTLYERFFDAIAPRSIVRCVTSPVNQASLAFHTSIGFEVEKTAASYDGRGGDRVLLVSRLARA
jgi:ribosomal protein S18 acetylase RimI-like enzyme